MDLDRLEREFRDLKRRVEPLLADYEEHVRRRGPEPAPRSAGAHADAKAHLEDGDLAAAGAAVGLSRAHNGKEENESFERRIRALLFGAASADAVRPKPPAKADDADKVNALDPAGGKTDTGQQGSSTPPEGGEGSAGPGETNTGQ